MTTRQQEDLLHVLGQLDHLTAHLCDISTEVSENEPYDHLTDCEAQDLYIAAGDLVTLGLHLLRRFNPTAKLPASTGYHPSAEYLPDMPLKCCPKCNGGDNSHGMILEKVESNE